MTATHRWKRILASFVLALSASSVASAHEGHAEGKQAAPVPAAPAVRPPAHAASRFATASEAFELVGVLDGRRLTLWLDRFGDNSPVVGATLELEIGDERVSAASQGDVYVAQLRALPAAPSVPITATVIANGTSDLLAADLALPQASEPVTDASTPSLGTVLRDVRVLGWMASSSVLAAALGWFAARRRRA